MREIARGLWRFVSKPRRLFDRSAATRDEHRLLVDLTVARSSESSLEAAAARGEQVADELAEVKARIADLAARLPRGHAAAFCGFASICVLSAAALWTTCGELRPIFEEMWGTLDNPYLLEFRYSTSRLAKVALFLTSPPWAGLGLLTVPVALWFLQRRLQRRHARTLAVAGAWLALATMFAFTIALFNMLFFPLP